MDIRAPVGLGAVKPGETLVIVVDGSDAPTLAGVSAGARVDRPTDVSGAIDLAGRWRADVVVLRVPLDEVARTDALRRLHSAAPTCRVVLLPVRHIGASGDRRAAPAAPATSGGAPSGSSAGLPPDAAAVVRKRALRPRTESASLAREVVRAACTDADARELCFDALLVATELVTNAVTHARTAVDLTVRACPATVRIEVYDRVTERPVPRPADVLAGGGRGLTMMDALCSAWGIDPSVKGKTVWAQLVSPGL